MFKTNEGTLDRALRIIVGLALIAGFFLSSGGGWSWLFLLGIVPLATGLLGSCPVYSIFGIKTCKMKS